MTHCHCGATWAGLCIAHCTGIGCHRTFATVEAFDIHRQASRKHGCADPATTGLIRDRFGYWDIKRGTAA